MTAQQVPRTVETMASPQHSRTSHSLSAAARAARLRWWTLLTVGLCVGVGLVTCAVAGLYIVALVLTVAQTVIMFAVADAARAHEQATTRVRTLRAGADLVTRSTSVERLYTDVNVGTQRNVDLIAVESSGAVLIVNVAYDRGAAVVTAANVTVDGRPLRGRPVEHLREARRALANRGITADPFLLLSQATSNRPAHTNSVTVITAANAAAALNRNRAPVNDGHLAATVATLDAVAAGNEPAPRAQAATMAAHASADTVTHVTAPTTTPEGEL